MNNVIITLSISANFITNGALFNPATMQTTHTFESRKYNKDPKYSLGVINL